MTDLALIASDPSGLAQYADPGKFVVHACERARDWLAQAMEHGDIEQIVELKSQAEAIRVYTTTKQLGRDAELAAAEIVRRAERGIGVCIRRGQQAGEITAAPTLAGARTANNSASARPTDFASTTELNGNGSGIYAMTDGVTDEQFEEAVEEAKAEGNLSRANVVRKAKAKPTPPPARHEIHRKAPHLKAERIIEQTIAQLEGIAMGLALIEDVSSLDAEKRLEWLHALSQPLAAINRFKKELAR